MCTGRSFVRNVDVALANENAWLAAERMHQRSVGALVVLNSEREPIGIVTDRDLVERVLAKRLNPDKTLVQQIMTMDPQTIYEGAPIEAALSMMRDGSFRRLPVVDHEGKLCGLICLDDVLITWARNFATVAAVLKSETPHAIAEQQFVSVG